MAGSERRELAIVLAALAAGALGQTMLLVGVNVLVLQRMHSAPAVAALWIVPQVALLATGSLAGRYTDRWDKRRTLAFTNIIAGAAVLLLVAAGGRVIIYGVFAFVAVLGGMFLAAFNPYFRELVPPSRRARANAVKGGFQYGSLVLGPALAGVLLIHGRPDTVIACVAVALLLSGALLHFAPSLSVAEAAGGARESPSPTYLGDLKMVAAFLKARPVTAGVMASSGLLLVFGAAADAQEVVFVHRALHLGASDYGLLVSTAGVGYLAGAGVSFLAASRTPLRWLLGVGEVLAALGYLFYALSHGFFLAAAGLTELGMAQAVASTGYGTFIQGALPVSQMGRITATMRSVFAGLTILVTLSGGYIVQAVGVRPWMVGATAAMVLAGLGMAAVCMLPAGVAEFRRAAAT